MRHDNDSTGFIVPHDPAWHQAFRQEAFALREALSPLPITLHHIGSTAIDGLSAKPVIDLLAVVPDLQVFDQSCQRLLSLGYSAKGENGINGRRFFEKRDANAQRSHHLHVFEQGAPQVTPHLAFRDYLIARPDVAAAYGALKETLVQMPDFSRAAYITGKAAFVQTTTKDALHWAAQSSPRTRPAD